MTGSRQQAGGSRRRHASSAGTCLPHSSSGFTLIGIMFAVTIVTLVVVALAGLTASTIKVGRAAEERFVATALAREGIELVRSLRDDNWLAYPAGTTQMKWRGDAAAAAPAQERRRAICNATNRVIDLLSCPSSICGTAAEDGPMLIDWTSVGAPGTDPVGQLYLDADGTYTHTPTGTRTPFRRTITIQTPTGGVAGIPRQGSGDCGEVIDGGVAGLPREVHVISRVEWQVKGGEPLRSVELREELHNWIRAR